MFLSCKKAVNVRKTWGSPETHRLPEANHILQLQDITEDGIRALRALKPAGSPDSQIVSNPCGFWEGEREKIRNQSVSMWETFSGPTRADYTHRQTCSTLLWPVEILKHHITPITCICDAALWAGHVTELLDITTEFLLSISIQEPTINK
jgi:hypothetical protein